MKKILIFLLLSSPNAIVSPPNAIVFDSYGHTPSNKERSIFYIKQNTRQYSKKYQKRIVLVVIAMAHKYKIDYLNFSKQLNTESDFYYKAKSSYGALGIGQIVPCHWDHLLYKVDGGKLGKYLLRRNTKNTDKYFYRIGYSVEMAAIIMSNYIAKYGCWEKALLMYGYKRKTAYKFFKDPYKAKYVRDILGAKK